MIHSIKFFFSRNLSLHFIINFSFTREIIQNKLTEFLEKNKYSRDGLKKKFS